MPPAGFTGTCVDSLWSFSNLSVSFPHSYQLHNLYVTVTHTAGRILTVALVEAILLFLFGVQQLEKKCFKEEMDRSSEGEETSKMATKTKRVILIMMLLIWPRHKPQCDFVRNEPVCHRNGFSEPGNKVSLSVLSQR